MLYTYNLYTFTSENSHVEYPFPSYEISSDFEIDDETESISSVDSESTIESDSDSDSDFSYGDLLDEGIELDLEDTPSQFISENEEDGYTDTEDDEEDDEDDDYTELFDDFDFVEQPQQPPILSN